MPLFKKEPDKSPIHYIFLATVISIKNQYLMKEDLEKELGVEIIIERENGCALFKTTQCSQEKCIKYCQSHKTELIDKYELESIDNGVRG